MMKRALVVLICLAMMCGVGCAEGTFQFFMVEDEKPALGYYREPGMDGEQYVIMAAHDSNDEIVASVYLACSPGFDVENSDFYLEVYELSNGKYYVEHWFTYEGCSREYMLISYGDDGFIVERWATDPGYTSAYGLYDGLTGEELVYGEYEEGCDPEAEIDAALNSMFEGNGILFENCSWIEIEGESLTGMSRAGVEALSVLPGAELLIADVVATGDVNLRSGPGKEFEKLGSMKKGEKAEFLGETAVDSEGKDWYRVRFGDCEEAWVSSKYSELEYREAAESGDLEAIGTVVLTGDVYVRSGPGLSYDQLGVVKTGGELEYLGRVSTDDRGVDWYRVTYGEYEEAWVSSRYSEIRY